MSNAQATVAASFDLIQAAQGGFELGSSGNAYQAFNNAINLASTFAGQSPYAVGLNSAAVTNNTVAAVNAYSTGALQPSDVLQITSSGLALAVAAAAVAGAPVSLSAIALAGVVGIVAGPGPLKDSFNEYVTLIGQKISDGLLRNDLAVNPAEIQQYVPEDNGGMLISRQYTTPTGEFYSFEIVYSNGRSTGEVGRTVQGGVLPTITVGVSGSFENPTGFDFTNVPSLIDTSNAQQVASNAWALDTNQSNSIVSAVQATMNSNDNAASFTDTVLSSAGFSGYYTSDFLIDGTGLNAYGILAETIRTADWSDGGWMYSLGTGAEVSAARQNAMNQYFSLDTFTGTWLDAYNSAKATYGPARWDDEITNLENTWIANGASPIVLDLDGNGISTIALNHSTVNFDITGDGKKERTAWVNGGDAFLAMDQNGNGRIDGVSELFGGLERGDGFRKLALLDGNADGVLKAADGELSGLLAWKDTNTDGITDEGELMGVNDLGLLEINLDYLTTDIREHGNLIGEVSTATTATGTSMVADIYFQYQPTSAGTTAFQETPAGSINQLISSMAAFPSDLPSVEFVQPANSMTPTLALNPLG